MLRLSHHFRGKRHVIWDWNGTLLDDVDLCIDIGMEIMRDFGYPPLTRERYLRLMRFPIIDYYEALGVDFERTPFADMSRVFVAKYKARVHECSLFEGVEELLAHLAERGIRNSILSAANENDLFQLLEARNLTAHFTHVRGQPDHHAGAKIDCGLQLLQHIEEPLEELIMVGDTDHDAAVAKALGIDILVFADGHQHYDTIIASHRHALANRYSLS